MSWIPPLVQGPLVLWDVRVPAREVAFIKGVLDASEGVGALFAVPRPRRGAREPGSRVVVVAPIEMAAAAAEVLADLEREIGERMQVVPLSDVQCFDEARGVEESSTTVA